ncbi:hypothetical protein SIID45300_00861 [Candidatus Magnetaquicoccaceae bacterium FCR-1]|uniref:Uncharacterized protein n=1 Tax=Candidatus Magnetaquiglobus chichijimensis TaxID=3141448 RepID=A0ABQ0C6N6_9PROT
MPALDPSSNDVLFRVQDPVQLLEIHAQEELQRRKAANPSLDLTLHQDAVELLMSRLNAPRPTMEGVA